MAKNPARPFVVCVGGVDVRAVGTAFAVRLAPENVEVIVTEGRVALSTAAAADGPANPPPVTLVAALDAGQRAVIARASPATPPRLSAVEREAMTTQLAWRQPRLEFTDTTRTEASALFNRTAHGARLRVADAAVAGRRITGVFRADNVDGFVTLLEASLGVRAERRGDGEIVLCDAR